MAYSIRQAKSDDLERIKEIYAYARSFMASTGNPNQWGSHHPPIQQTVQDIEEGKLLLVTEGKEVHGVFYFSTEADPTYAEIFDGAWHADAPYGVIHRIAGDGAGGVVKAAADYAAQRIPYLRIDTHKDNRVMQHVLMKNGFHRCGIICLKNGDPRIAFDRV